MLRHLIHCIALLTCAAPLAQADDLPLFASDEVLDIVFEAPMNTIVREADERPEVEGVLHYTADDGQTVTLPLSMTTRGKSRLAYCHFPPLSINLKRKETDGTLFAGQNKLKVVTRCRRGSTFERYLHQEHGIYQAFNAVSEYGFRVRRLNVTYRDSEGKRDDETQFAYFIESDNEVAARTGMEKLKVSKIDSAQLDPAHENKFALFQFLIANTDWSVIKGAAEESCCHNGKVIITPGSVIGWIVLPYDFDQAGLINAKYSMPAEGLGIRSVRQRLFRGRCRNIDQLDDTVALFNERRAAIEAALLPEALDNRSRKSAARYIDDFYEIMNEPKDRQKIVADKCIGS